jgi:hypothetical protein
MTDHCWSTFSRTPSVDITITTPHWTKNGAEISSGRLNKRLAKTSSPSLIANEWREYILPLIKTATKRS